jgi:DNA primase
VTATAAVGTTPTVRRIFAANEAAFQYWRWHATRPGEWTHDYLVRRGLPDLAAGYAPTGWARLAPTLLKRGFTEADLLGAGLVIRSAKGSLGDAFRDRLVLPIRNSHDHIIGFTARRRPDGDETAPKYINTATTTAFDKSSALYGLDSDATRRITAGATVIIVEGALDVEAVKHLGPTYVPLAACGTAITTRHLMLLRNMRADALNGAVVMLDPDPAGVGAALRLWHQLADTEAGTIRYATLPGGVDPAQLLQEHRLDDLRDAVECSDALTSAIIDHTLASHGQHIEGRLAALRTAATHLARLDPYLAAAAASPLFTQVAERLDHETILAELLKAFAAKNDRSR